MGDLSHWLCGRGHAHTRGGSADGWLLHRMGQPLAGTALEARSVDVLQADATRCGGITGFLQAAVLCAAYGVPLSAHTAPALHLHPACAVSGLRHLEYFHDHVRIERLFFAGVAELKNGLLAPDLSLPGLGLELKQEDVHKFRSL